MKITKDQVEALVSQEIRKNREDRLKELNIYKNSIEVKNKIKSLIKEYNSLSSEIKQYYHPINESTILNKLISYYKYKTLELDSKDLRNKITIATIEAKDLTELKKILKLS